jgi:hypothetical protein
MLDPANVLQQEAIGILGVNLIYAAFYEVQIKESFLEGLAQDVVAERIEIDYVDLRGPAFESWDHRALQVHLVRAGTQPLKSDRPSIIKIHGTHDFRSSY